MKFVAVTVLYHKKVADLPFADLFPYFNAEDISLVLYDNSEKPQEELPQEKTITYVHDKRNIGLVPAYNLALQMAKEQGAEGVLLLDHDTEISREYLETLKNETFSGKVGCIVPQIRTTNGIISPLKADAYINHQHTPLTTGTYDGPYMAINSGSLISVKALEEIGGFNEEFPLDFLDHWLFHALGEKNYQIKVLQNVIDHDLSVLDYKNVSHRRYESILAGERIYYSKYHQDFLKNHQKQLLKRTLKQLVKVSDKYFFKRTFQEYLTIRKLKV